MAKLFKLRSKADKDLEKIYRYSVEGWGTSHANSYIFDMEKAFQNLASNSQLGRDCSGIKTNLRAFRVVSHVIFYKPTAYGVTIIRILHKSMDEQRHF